MHRAQYSETVRYWRGEKKNNEKIRDINFQATGVSDISVNILTKEVINCSI